MKTIQTKSGEILLVKVPEEAYLIDPIDNPKFKYSIRFINCLEIHFIKYNELNPLGKFSELEDKDFEEFVHGIIQNDPPDQEIKFRGFWTDYLDYSKYLSSSKHSFETLCKSQGIEDDLNDYLLIKKL